MAKTYILEPTELQFKYQISSYNNYHNLSADTEDFNVSDFVQGQTELNVSNFVEGQTELDVPIDITLKYAGADGTKDEGGNVVSYSYIFTPDGTMPQSPPAIYAVYTPSEEGSGILLPLPAALVISSQTAFNALWASGNTYELTTSIYTESGSGGELTPITREEMYLDAIAKGTSIDLVPVTRTEMYLYAIANGTSVSFDAVTRKEMFLNKIVNKE